MFPELKYVAECLEVIIKSLIYQ